MFKEMSNKDGYEQRLTSCLKHCAYFSFHSHWVTQCFWFFSVQSLSHIELVIKLEVLITPTDGKVSKLFMTVPLGFFYYHDAINFFY